MNDTFDKVLVDLLKARYDTVSTKDESYARQLMAVHLEFVKRNQKLTGLLDDYIQNKHRRTQENRICKRVIFWLFIAFFVALTVTLIVVLLKIDFNNADIESVLSLISVAATYLASILSIIKIISQYLFPADEEKDTIEMIKTVIQNDVQVEDVMSKAIDKSDTVDVETIKKCKELLEENLITQEEFNVIKRRILHLEEKTD